MQRIMSRYVRRYNQRQERSGPLLRSRFNSKHVDSDGYWLAVVRYIDQNPVEAGLASSAVAYEFSSRRHYARMRGPAWLTRDRVEAEVRVGSARYDPDRYDRVFTRPATRLVADTLERSVVRGDRPGDPNFDVLDAATPAIREWLLRNAVLADGRRIGPTLVHATIVEQVVAEHQHAAPTWLDGRSGHRSDRWQVLLAGLLRALAGRVTRPSAYG